MRDVAVGILNDLTHTSRIQIPKNFQKVRLHQMMRMLSE